MLPTRINIMPPDKRHHLVRMIRFQFIRFVAQYICVITILAAGIIFSGWWILDGYSRSVEAQLASIDSDRPGIVSRVGEVNTDIRRLEQAQNGHLAWGSILRLFGNQIPEGITLVRVVIGADGSLQFSGVADTRDVLLQFEGFIRESGFIDSISIPVSQLVKRENISFTVATRIDFVKLYE